MAGAKLFAKEDRRKGENVDLPFLALTLLLLTVGLVVLYSASSAQSAYDTRYAITTRYLPCAPFWGWGRCTVSAGSLTRCGITPRGPCISSALPCC